VEVFPPRDACSADYALHASGRQIATAGRLFINFMIEK